ncbi:hypothetical protein D3C85_969180 [compost metagenome]
MPSDDEIAKRGLELHRKLRHIVHLNTHALADSLGCRHDRLTGVAYNSNLASEAPIGLGTSHYRLDLRQQHFEPLQTHAHAKLVTQQE